jgi:hypothetical protein
MDGLSVGGVALLHAGLMCTTVYLFFFDVRKHLFLKLGVTIKDYTGKNRTINVAV